MKDYGIEGVQNITLVADPRHEGLSRGFAFVEFSSHAEATMAYKRLQKPDVVFGHLERTAKVAFAEPSREPDPKVMTQVKSVFIDGLPPHWDEDYVRENLQVFREISRIMLARNMPTAKRKDFGFVDFSTHEAAVSCVEGVDGKGLGDGNSKVKVHARLSNPLPKMQGVKGGMCGGFLIGHGRSYARGGHPFHRNGHGFYPNGPGYDVRMGFPYEQEFDNPCSRFHGRPNFGRGRRWDFKGAYLGPLPARPYLDRVRHGSNATGYGDYDSHRRYPYSFEEGYDRSFMGRHFDEPYRYDDVDHQIKRPYYNMLDLDANLAEPRRYRCRLDHLDPVIPFHTSRFQASENLEADGGFFRHKYYGSDGGDSSYSSFYGDDHTYRCGYYY